MEYTKELHEQIDVAIFNEINDEMTLSKDIVIAMHNEIERLQSLTQWVRCELYEPEEYGDVLEFIDKAGNIYKGYWNCGYISCDETGHASIQILDVVGWRLFKALPTEGVK